MNRTALDQYEEIVTDALKSCSAKLRKSFKTAFIQIMILYMVLPRKMDKQSRRTAGDFLYISAKQKGNLDSREQVKAQREVNNVVEGHYDHQQKQGFSMRR